MFKAQIQFAPYFYLQIKVCPLKRHQKLLSGFHSTLGILSSDDLSTTKLGISV